MLNATDLKLIKDIENKIDNNKDYWDFKKNQDSERDYVHNLFSYPAMMVPKMQRELLNMVIESTSTNKGSAVKSILDPFVGSGTIVVEGMLRGLDVTGIDINPLAILLCKVKTTPLDLFTLQRKMESLRKRINVTEPYEIPITNFSGLTKWFKEGNIQQLNVIKSAIRKETDVEYRRFFWVSFCQTVRSVSNSRSVTFKLHIKDEKEIQKFQVDAIELFFSILNENYTHFALFMSELIKRKHVVIENGKPRYKNNVNIIYGDSRKVLQELNDKKFDLLFTSPPYGDNHTTVTYGQYSVLQLRWMDTADIGINIDEKVLSTISEIDRRSLGGTTNKSIIKETCADIVNYSNTLLEQINKIKLSDEHKIYKVLTFYNDLKKCISDISSAMNADSYLIWTVGIRKVAFEDIQMNAILEELASQHNLELIYDFERGIHKKRMPDMNAYKGEKDNLIKTMKKEIVMIFKKII